jgi:glycosyltransferase involved in cell wall biosynthesis
MRIVYLSRSIIPSSSANSINVIKMCNAFSENGHEVTLLSIGDSKFTNSEDSKELFNFYGVKQCFKISYLKWLKIPGYGIIYAIISALKVVIRIKPDLVYGRYLPGCLLTSLFNVPTIYESHGPFKYPEIITRILLFIMIRNKKFKKMIVLSKKLGKYFNQRYNMPDSFMIVAYNGADQLKKNDRIKLKISKKRIPNIALLQVGYIGSLYDGKGMEIISELIKNCPWAEFHIIGGLEKDFKKWSRNLADYKNGHFYGHLAQSKASLYAFMFDVLLLPSKKIVSVYGGNKNFKQYYSPPIKLFEYMQAGKAIISSNFLDEILVDHENALLCDPENVNCWIDALEQLRDNPSLRFALGKNARDEFIAKYTWLARAHRVLDGML